MLPVWFPWLETQTQRLRNGKATVRLRIYQFTRFSLESCNNTQFVTANFFLGTCTNRPAHPYRPKYEQRMRGELWEGAKRPALALAALHCGSCSPGAFPPCGNSVRSELFGLLFPGLPEVSQLTLQRHGG